MMGLDKRRPFAGDGVSDARSVEALAETDFLIHLLPLYYALTTSVTQTVRRAHTLLAAVVTCSPGGLPDIMIGDRGRRPGNAPPNATLSGRKASNASLRSDAA
jgi:hypothetical protein